MDMLRDYMRVSKARACQTQGRETRKMATEDEEQNCTRLDSTPQSAVEGWKLDNQ